MTLVVLGAPGTGASVLGAALGAPPCDATDPLVAGVGRHHRELLASLGWCWDAPPAEPERPRPPRPEAVAAARDLAGAGLRLPADPRLSLLLPWWREALLDRIVAVVVTRDPSTTAGSLFRRRALPPSLGLAVWAAYHRHLAAGLSGLPCVVVDTARLASDPRTTIRDLGRDLERLGAVAPPGPMPSAIDAAWGEPARASREPAPDVPSGSAIGRLASAWAGAVGPHAAAALPDEPPDGWEVELLAEHRRTRALEGRIDEVVGEREDAHQEVARLQRALDGMRTERDALARHLVATGRTPPVGGRVADDPRSVTPGPVRAGAATGAARRRGGRGLPTPLRRIVGPVLSSPLARVVPNPLFDRRWYLARYPDARAVRRGAWHHWRRYGWREGRDPNPWFDTDWYLGRYPDVQEVGIDPLLHFLLHGAREGRRTRPGPGDRA